MWFKTRVGLVSITELSQILVYQRPDDSRWTIYARLTPTPEMGVRRLWGIRRRESSDERSFHLAIVSNGPSASVAIGECMAKIATAIKAGDGLCDLSESGDAEAWGKAWHKIHWPK